MKRIAIITDSAAMISDELQSKENIFVLPLNIVFKDKTYKEEIDITSEEFYNLLQNEHPTTSQPTIGDTISLFEQLKVDGYTEAIAIHCSTELSGTLNSTQLAANETNFTVHTIDSRIGSYPMQKMVEYAYESIENKKDISRIISDLTEMTKRTELYILPANLEQLNKSGRVSNAQLFLGNLLNVKLLLGFDDGKVVLKEKIRSEKKALRTLISKVSYDYNAKNIDCFSIIHCNHTTGANQLKSQLLEQYPLLAIDIVSLTAAVGVHAGDKTLGISWIKKQN